MSIWAGHPTPPPGTNITSEYGWCTQDQDWHIQFLGSQRSKYLQESLFCNAFEQIQKSIQLTTPTVCSRRSQSTASAKIQGSWPISTNTTSSGSSAIKSTVRRSCTRLRKEGQPWELAQSLGSLPWQAPSTELCEEKHFTRQKKQLSGDSECWSSHF